MNFNSVVFLFCFMPLALGLYYLVPGRVKNAVLLVESLLFFCWGGITWLPLAVGMATKPSLPLPSTIPMPAAMEE